MVEDPTVWRFVERGLLTTGPLLAFADVDGNGSVSVKNLVAAVEIQNEFVYLS